MPDSFNVSDTKHEVTHVVKFEPMGILFSALATLIVIGVRAKFFK